MTRAVLSLGANLGDRAGAIRTALTALTEEGLVARKSLNALACGLKESDEGIAHLQSH